MWKKIMAMFLSVTLLFAPLMALSEVTVIGDNGSGKSTLQNMDLDGAVYPFVVDTLGEGESVYGEFSPHLKEVVQRRDQ